MKESATTPPSRNSRKQTSSVGHGAWKAPSSPVEPRSPGAHTPAPLWRRDSLKEPFPRRETAPLRGAVSERSERKPAGDLSRAGAPDEVRSLVKNTRNVSTPHAEGRRLRYALREVVRDRSTQKRVQKCGRVRVAEHVTIRRGAHGAHYSGVMSCGSVWLCPVCASKIAARRNREVTHVLTRHLGESGGGVAFLTLTVPHDKGDSLAHSFATVNGGWRKIVAGRAWKALCQELGVVGFVRTSECTHGGNGWHPHMHVLVFTARPLTDEQLDRLRCHAFGVWSAHVQRNGFRAPLVERSPIERVQHAAIGDYATKFGAALELTHGMQKRGRNGSRTPFQILADFANGGDCDDLKLWHEWEHGSKGRKQLTWSRGLKARLEVEDLTDEQIAAEDVGGEDVAVIDADTWALVVRLPHYPVRLLEAAEQPDGARCVAELLERLRRPPDTREQVR